MAVAMSLLYQDRAYYYEAKENTNVLVGRIVLLMEVYLKTNHCIRCLLPESSAENART